MKRQRNTAGFKSEATRLLMVKGQSALEASQRLDVNTGRRYHLKRDHLAKLDLSNRAKVGSTPSQMS